MTSADDVILSLTEAAAEVERREQAFRTETAITAKRLEIERSTAFRRLNFMRTLTDLAASAETGEAAAMAAQAHIRARFGWDSESDARTGVLERIAPVAVALFACARAAPSPSVPESADAPPSDTVAATDLGGQEPQATALAALADFENWYEQTRASSFWFLFEHYMPETPRVDY